MSHIHFIAVTATQSYATVGTPAQQSVSKYSNLDLPEAQRTKLRALFISVKQSKTSRADAQKQLSSILTPAQQRGQRVDGDVEATLPVSTPASAAATQATASVSNSTVPREVVNIRNQAAAAQPVLVQSLQRQALATNDYVTFA